MRFRRTARFVWRRTTRPKTPVIYPNDEVFKIGQAKVIKQSEDDQLTIVAGGITLFEALAAYEILNAEGIKVRVIDIFSVKPVDEATLRTAGKQTNGLVLTVEDHSDGGGIGDAVAGAVSQEGIRVHALAVREVPRSGKSEELMAAYGIDRTAIVARVKSLLGR
jgi:transketolase